MNAGQWVRNARTLCGLSQLEARKLWGKPDGFVPAIECGRVGAYLSDLEDLWIKLTAQGYKLSRPTGDLDGLRRGNAPQARPPITLKLGLSQGGVLEASEATAIVGFAGSGAGSSAERPRSAPPPVPIKLRYQL